MLPKRVWVGVGVCVSRCGWAVEGYSIFLAKLSRAFFIFAPPLTRSRPGYLFSTGFDPPSRLNFRDASLSHGKPRTRRACGPGPG